MPPLLLFSPAPRLGPTVLPRGCECLVEFRADGWPLLLVIPNDCGLFDPYCTSWHGDSAANDAD